MPSSASSNSIRCRTTGSGVVSWPYCLRVGVSTPVVPIIAGDSIKATVIASRLLAEGVNVLPIIYPAVPEKSARLRFFLTANHTTQQIDEAIDTLKQVWTAFDENPVGMDKLQALVGMLAPEAAS